MSNADLAPSRSPRAGLPRGAPGMATTAPSTPPPHSGLPLEQLRSEPFRLFFPLAFLLGAAGVSHWVLFSAGLLGRYLNAFHAVTQMQSFMVAFAGGFLMTAIPKRTRTAPATWIEIAGLALLLPAVSLAELFDLS